jgi:putative DeoR family transcriptional regulator (stage III sporulation protein D)
MKEIIRERTIMCAEYIIEHNATLRQVAKEYGIGKSTVHSDMSRRLPKLDIVLASQVQAVLKDNRDTRHLRGGESTKRKYLQKKLVE